MSTDLVVASELSSSLQTVQDQDENNSALAISTANVTVGLPAYISSPVNNGKLLTVVGSESTSNGFGASVTISNQAQAPPANWYLRAGATGTATPPGGFSIANDAAYMLSITNGGNVGIHTNNPQATLDVNGSANISGTLTAGALTVSGTLTVPGLALSKPTNPPSGADLRGVVIDLNTGNLYYL